jgi:hypothetical protein
MAKVALWPEHSRSSELVAARAAPSCTAKTRETNCYEALLVRRLAGAVRFSLFRVKVSPRERSNPEQAGRGRSESLRLRRLSTLVRGGVHDRSFNDP